MVMIIRVNLKSPNDILKSSPVLALMQLSFKQETTSIFFLNVDITLPIIVSIHLEKPTESTESILSFGQNGCLYLKLIAKNIM